MANFGTKAKTAGAAAIGSAAVGAGAAAAAAATSSSKTEPSAYPKDCPPDVTQLGRSTWTFLHSVAASYPEKPTESQQTNMVQFLNIFAKIYPCWFCAKDFENYISKPETKPKVTNQEEFGKWLCDAHNEVNVKLGKPKFDCNLWKQRWKDGWDDGSCD